LSNANAGLTAHGHQALQPVVVTFARNQNLVKTPPAGLEGLFHRVQPVENFHEG
jgi:hypothetical protein